MTNRVRGPAMLIRLPQQGVRVLTQPMILPILTILACFAAAPRLASGQAGKPLVQITGLVRDSASGRAPTRTQVCAFADTGGLRPYPHCGHVDSLGSYHIDSVESGPRLLTVHCASLRAPYDHQLGYEHLIVGQANLHRDWIVRGELCDPRPIRHITATFSGYYAPGFEMSAFVPCQSDSWLIAGDSLGTDARKAPAWASWSPTLSTYRLPSVATDAFGMRRYFVRWRGTVTGPGHYGHLGGSAFEISVDSVVEVRAASGADCQ